MYRPFCNLNGNIDICKPSVDLHIRVYCDNILVAVDWEMTTFKALKNLTYRNTTLWECGKSECKATFRSGIITYKAHGKKQVGVNRCKVYIERTAAKMHLHELKNVSQIKQHIIINICLCPPERHTAAFFWSEPSYYFVEVRGPSVAVVINAW